MIIPLVTGQICSKNNPKLLISHHQRYIPNQAPNNYNIGDTEQNLGSLEEIFD